MPSGPRIGWRLMTAPEPPTNPMFYSLDSTIADMVIAAIDTEGVWDSYRPNLMKPEKWAGVGREIRLALVGFSFDNEGGPCSKDEFKRGWKLLGRYFGLLWN